MVSLPNGESIRCILNLFYEPVESTRRLVEENSDWFIPIHGGHASPKYSNEWMSKHLIGDDTGDNVSSLNEKINENTAIYWVWKHYGDELVGNPDWIGFNHYRRYFDRKKIKSLICEEHADAIIGSSLTFDMSIAQQYAKYHYVEDLFLLESVLPKNDVMSFQRYIGQTTMYAPAFLFFLRKEQFFAWCEYAFPIIFDLVDLIDTTGRNLYNKRAICFLAERLLGFYIIRNVVPAVKNVIATPAEFDVDAKSVEIMKYEVETKI